MMKKSVTLLAVLPMLAMAAAPAFAMTKQKAKQLGTAAASKGNAAVLTHLEAVAQGNAMAETNLGVACFFGQGVPQDGLKAFTGEKNPLLKAESLAPRPRRPSTGHATRKLGRSFGVPVCLLPSEGLVS